MACLTVGMSRQSPMDTASSHYGDKTTPHSSHDQLAVTGDHMTPDPQPSLPPPREVDAHNRYSQIHLGDTGVINTRSAMDGRVINFLQT